MNTLAKGFTLIEVMVAAAIGVVISVLAYQALSGSINIEQRVNHVSESTNELVRVWQLLGSDIQHAVARGSTDQFNQPQPAMKGLLGDRLSQSNVLAAQDDSYLLRFTRSGENNFLKLPRSNLQMVGYRITADDTIAQDEGNISLWRDHWRPVDAASEVTVKSRRLLDNINTIRFRYLPQSSENLDEQSWLSGWPESNTQNSELPIAIEVELDVQGMGKLVRIFQLTQTQLPGANNGT